MNLPFKTKSINFSLKMPISSIILNYSNQIETMKHEWKRHASLITLKPASLYVLCNMSTDEGSDFL